MNRSTTLKVLRNFGHLFSDIVICYGPLDEAIDSKYIFELEWYLVEYCLKSMQKITIYCINPEHTTAFENTGIQLPNITTVHTGCCRFASNFSFNANFPNLQSLSLHEIKCEFNIKDWQFPTVKHLYFHCTAHRDQIGSVQYSYMKESDLIEMLKHNPQLEKLELFITYEYLSNLSKCLNEYFPKLHFLSLTLIEFKQ